MGRVQKAERWDGPVNASPADSCWAGQCTQGFREKREISHRCVQLVSRVSEESLLAIVEENNNQAKNNRCDFFEWIFILENSAFEAMEYSFEQLNDWTHTQV